NDFAARFPSAVAAALVALSIFGWGSRPRPPRQPSGSQAHIGRERVGWWAAIIFTLSLQTFLHAKAAVADMWLVLFMTLAHWAAWQLIELQKTPNTERRNLNTEWFWWAMFYLSLALGFLAKGP